MPKPAMPTNAVTAKQSEPKFKGQTVVLAGKFSWNLEEKIRAAVLSEGGSLSTTIADGVTIIVGSDSRGTPAPVKEAEKLIKKGARIEVVKEDDLFAQFFPDNDALAALFKEGNSERFRLLSDLDPTFVWGVKRDFSKRDFSNLVFDGFPLEDMILDDCIFNNSSFRTGDLKATGSKFPRAKFDLTSLCEVKNCDFQEAQLICLYIITSMENCDLSKATLAGVSARACKFKNTKFTNANLKNTLFDYSSFENCDFTSSSWETCGANGVTFKNCKFKNASMKQAWLIACTFIDCDFTDCDLTNANLALSKFKNSKLDGATFTDAVLAGASLKELQAHTSKVKGLKEAIDEVSHKTDLAKLAEINELVAAANGSSAYSFEAIVEIPEAKILCRVYSPAYYTNSKPKVGISFADVAPKEHYVDLVQGEYLERRDTWMNQSVVDSLPDALHNISCIFNGYNLLLDSVTAKVTKGTIKPKEFRNLAVRAWCAAFGTPALTDEEIKKLDSEKKDSSAKERDKYTALLRSGPDGIKSFNEMMAERKSKLDLKKVDLSGCDLTGTNFHGAQLNGANLENCVMKQCSLEFATLSNANAKGVLLDQSNCRLLLAENADFSDASMSGADFSRANFMKSSLRDTKCNGANFTDTSLIGVDLLNADLTEVHFERTQYNEKTILPKGYEGAPGLEWHGYGTDPAKIREVMDDEPDEPLDFAKFLERLEASIDKERLKKAIKMLQAESFQLFAEVTSKHMIGVVKSQTDPDLVYSCQLTSDGKFCCGTQNLNSCGGLRGALCKHLLVLLLGLTRADELDATTADAWARSSKLQSPKMEKDIMSETFLRYKGAEAGEIDWRPTETVPEDYYAF